MHNDEAITKVMGVMTKVWDYQPTQHLEAEWKQHAIWLVGAIEKAKPRAEMDEYMSRVQMHMRVGGSMAFRKIVDRSIEVVSTGSTAPVSNRVEKLNPTVR
jgi:hypothetical protein